MTAPSNEVLSTVPSIPPQGHRSFADLGGQDRPGRIRAEPEGETFHGDWEARTLGLTLAMGATGAWNLDAVRATRESLPGYDRLSYYEIWLAALETMLQSRGFVSAEELREGRSHASQSASPGTAPAARPTALPASRVAAVLARGAPTERPASHPPAFAVGQHVRTRTGPFDHHVRLPRYTWGRRGVVESLHGMHVFPDTHAHGLGEQPQWLYTVVFEGAELWGPDSASDLRLSVDAFEPYLVPDLEPCPEDGRKQAPTASARQDRPTGEDEAAFREPWEASIFALVLALHERGLYTWGEWTQALTQTLAQAGPAATGPYVHWLQTLERLLAERGVTDAPELRAHAQAWARAAARTPHGQPLELRPQDFAGTQP